MGKISVVWIVGIALLLTACLRPDVQGKILTRQDIGLKPPEGTWLMTPESEQQLVGRNHSLAYETSKHSPAHHFFSTGAQGGILRRGNTQSPKDLAESDLVGEDIGFVQGTRYHR
jgi:hypothetical protein